jgi:hypothetical protein
MNPGLFRAASLQTRRARFPGTGLSRDLCCVRDGARVDPVVADGADDERLAPHFRHKGGPGGLARSRLPERFEAGDLVDCHRGAGLAQLAFPPAEPSDQLLARVGGLGRDGVTDDRPPVPFQDDPAESCRQVRFALAVLPGLEAGPQPVPGLDLGLVTGRHLGDGAAVLGGQGLQRVGIRGPRPSQPKSDRLGRYVQGDVDGRADRAEAGGSVPAVHRADRAARHF